MAPYLDIFAGYPIPVFALALDLALVCGLAVTVVLARRRGIAPHRVLDTSLLVLAAALGGSRMWYVAAHWGDYASSPIAVLAIWEGGLALPGAVIGGALATPPAARRMGVPIAEIAAAGGIGAAFGQAIGRLGCVPVGCAAGKPVEELWTGAPGLVLPDATGTLALRFPSQPVEAVCEAVLAFALWLLWRHRVAPQRIALLYLAGYAAVRIAAEPLRA